MNAEVLAGFAGIVFSLAFSYFPGLNGWYEAFDPTKKRLVMLAVLAVTAVGVFAWACVGFSQQVSCDQAGALALLNYFIVAAIANQAAHRLSP